MKKIIVFFLLLTTIPIYSQVKLVEGEFLAGITFPKASNIYDDAAIVGMELRFNLNDGRYSTGFQIAKSAIGERRYEVEDSQRFFSIQSVFDYNYKPTGKIVPFAGIGLGLAKKDSNHWTDDNSSLILTPRIGCEFYKWIRLTCDYRMLYDDYSHFTLRFGLVIGGWNKK